MLVPCDLFRVEYLGSFVSLGSVTRGYICDPFRVMDPDPISRVRDPISTRSPMTGGMNRKQATSIVACFRFMHLLFRFMPLCSVKAELCIHFRGTFQNDDLTPFAMRLINMFALLLLMLFAASCGSPAHPLPEPTGPTHPELVKRGEYLVEIMGCHDCHSPKMMTPEGPVLDPDRLLSGHPANEANPPVDPKANPGWVLFNMGLTLAVGPWGTSFSGNITSDATGIGSWSEEQFKRAITKDCTKGWMVRGRCCHQCPGRI